MDVFSNALNALRKVAQAAGPYLLLELVLPGGTLCALLLFLWQRRHPHAHVSMQRALKAMMRTLAGVCATSLLVPAPARLAVRASKAASNGRR